MGSFNEDIFVISCWLDNDSKEKDLVNLINMLKVFNVPILLAGSYPVKPEIQKMADYYVFDKDNPRLTRDEFAKYNINSVRWTNMGNVTVENHREYHHDYAVWMTMKNAFNFCKYLGKKYIHFLDYDNLPDPIQYRQAFIERIRDHDFVFYEYNKGSSTSTNPYCAMFIFSIKTDIAVKVTDTIKNKDEYFRNKPNCWQLENNFLAAVRKVTNNLFLSPYIANNNELNMQSAWSREGTNTKYGIRTQFYLAVNDNDDIYLHTIYGDNNLVEVIYSDYKRILLLSDELLLYNIGKYQTGQTVKIYYQGIEMLSEKLEKSVNEYRSLNKIVKSVKMEEETPKININFVDGPFVEILGSQNKLYHVQFINQETDLIEFELDLKTNHWAKCSKKYYAKWLIKIMGIDNNLYLEHQINLKDQRVLISFESRSLGDTLAWIGYVEKFRIDHNCIVICSTFHNNLFRNQYPDIEFVDPGTTVPNIHALYRIGVFKKTGYNPNPDAPSPIDFEKHPSDPKGEPLTKVASDILGLDYFEIKPKLLQLGKEKKKVVSIANHGTAQCKYWNNPTGWQEVVDFLNKNGYEVKLLSSEIDGYMGNKNPEGVIKIQNKKIEDILKIIQESELFIGISSGLAWLSWGGGTDTILISGFTDDYTEPRNGVRRIINKNVCNSCWNKYDFNPGDWKWCPVHKGTDRQFECSKTITSAQVISEIKLALKI